MKRIALILLMLLPCSALAQVTLSNLPLSVNNVSVDLGSFGSDSGTTIAQVTDAPFSFPGGAMGTVSGRIEALPDRIELQLEGILTSPPDNNLNLIMGAAFFMTTVVPNVGDAQTPIYVTSGVDSQDSVHLMASSLDGNFLESATCPNRLLGTHTQPYTATNTAFPEGNLDTQFTAPAGDTIDFSVSGTIAWWVMASDSSSRLVTSSIPEKEPKPLGA